VQEIYFKDMKCFLQKLQTKQQKKQASARKNDQLQSITDS
jgi:hypothetical protein